MDRLVQLVTAFESAERVSDVARESLEYLNKLGNEAHQAHGRLCCAMLKAGDGGNTDMCNLLHFKGEAQVLTVVYNNTKHTKISTAKWLASEVLKILQSGSLTLILISNSKSEPNAPNLSMVKEHLVGVICRLPDILANRLGRHLKDALLPKSYFKRVGECLMECLECIHKKNEGDSSWSLLFPAAVLGKAASLGYQDVIMESFVPSLETCVMSEQLSWSKLSQNLFSCLPPASLEPVLEFLVNFASPSLLPSSPFCSLIGGGYLNHHRAKFVLAHKLILIRVPKSPHAVYNILGYLASNETGRGIMGKLLQSALEVWSDGTSLRHMDSSQHLWISRVIVLGVTLLEGHDELFEQVKQSLLKLMMTGVQIHIQSPLDNVRRVGMVLGECLMNKLNKTPKEDHKLKFEYKQTPETESIERLARPVSEQEENLKKEVEENTTVKLEAISDNHEEESTAEHSSPVERFGEGLVSAVECSDDDSDDDLVPYPMDDDPDSSQPDPPRYLRILMQDLLSTKEPQKVEIALATSESLIRSQPSDLKEVCVELVKILLHLSDSFASEGFCSQRHRAMVALSSLCPESVVPYLTQEFYAPNYSLRHRMDILEVISSSSLELSSPTTPSTQTPPMVPPTSSLPQWSTRKPWEEIIAQRLQFKTRVISHGPTRSPLKPVPNRFINVAPLFFFPLMSRYDHKQNTLDLLGEDSLVLGNLLYTLGTVMYAATNIPMVTPMAITLLDFLWAIRYHHDVYVRQGVLYGLGMIMWSTPLHALLNDVTTGLTEAVSWMKEVSLEDADEKCRVLARHALTLLNATMKQN